METKKNVQRKARWDVVGYNNADKHQHRHLANDRMKGDRDEEKEEEKKSMRFFAYVFYK
jgi:hypothetical protein